MYDEDDKDFVAEGREAELETGLRRREGSEGLESAAELRRRAHRDGPQRQARHMILLAPQPGLNREGVRPLQPSCMP